MQPTVIIGYDGSPNGEDALCLGRVLAEVLGARTVVATVLRFPDYLLGTSDLEAALERHAEPLFARAKERLAPLEVDTWARSDDSPAHALHELAEAESASLLVIGSSHRGPIGRVLVGTVGGALLSAAPCAIAVAPRGYAKSGGPDLREIGVAVNGAEESWVGLAAGTSLASRLHSTLTVLAVAELPHYGRAATVAILAAEDYKSLEEREKERVLDLAMKRVPRGVSAKRALLQGEPAHAIAEAAEDLDLLITGSRAYGPLRRVLLGGVSAKLMRSAPCPLLVLPRGAGDDPLDLRAAIGVDEPSAG